MNKINLRLQEIGDAKRFYEILRDPSFVKYFGVAPKSLKEEKDYLRNFFKDLAKGRRYNYTILYDNKVIGGIGVNINYHREYIGEIGYFVDRDYWGRGMATKAVKLLEKKCFNELKLKRIEVIMRPENTASEKVAIKAGYLKEGLLRKVVKDVKNKNKLRDAYLYAKVL